MSSQSSASMIEDVEDISSDDIVDLCSRVEKILTSSTGSDMRETDGMSRQETAIITILTSLIKSKCRPAEAAQILNNIFKDPQSSAQVNQLLGAVSAKYSSLLQQTFTLPGLHFKNLDWRFQATLASRSLLERCDPKLVMRLALQDRREDTQHTLDLETDVKTLENIVLSLEEALNEANTPSVRKLCKRYSVERAK